MSKKLTYAKEYFGKKINRLTVLRLVDAPEKRNTIVEAECECGVVKNYTLSNIISGHTSSCGCAYLERSKMLGYKHGLSSHPLHHVWTDMNERCSNPNSQNWHRYGGRGVIVCPEWKGDFKAFYDWAIDKWKPGLELDKDILSPHKAGIIYSPEYCCFVTQSENSKNKENSRMITYNGECLCLADWSKKTGKDYATLFYRLKIGMSVEDAFTMPNMNQNHHLKRKTA